MAVPTSKEITDFNLASSLQAIVQWAQVPEELRGPWATTLGLPGGSAEGLHPRTLAVVPEADYREAINSIRVGEAALTFFQKSGLHLVYKAAVHACSPCASQTTSALEGPSGPGGSKAKSLEGRKIKASNIIDPTDESEFPAAKPDQLQEWYDNYRELKHGDPLVDKDPSPDQIAAMHVRVVDLRLEPYADFSLLTPFGRRMAKTLRHRSWLLQEDGSYKPVEVPGPESFETWEACFKVYEVIMLMLRFLDTSADGVVTKSYVVTPIALEAYYEAFADLAKNHPECWHLCQKAEDRCRAEHFPRVARRLQLETGKAPSWSDVFVAAANDDRYWDREVRRPALAFLARGKRQLSQTEAAEKSHTDKVQEPPAKTRRQAKRERQAANSFRQLQAQPSGHAPPPPLQQQQQQHHQQPRGGHPRKNNKGFFVTTREGQEICFKFSRGERDACTEPCPNRRAHVCTKCLQPHRTATCTKST